MSQLGEDLIEGLQNALAHARGETVPGARTTVVDVQSADVRAIRGRLSLTQKEFAKTFGFALNTVRNWEQGTRRPARTAQILLALIDRHPDVVRETLTTVEEPHAAHA